MGIKEDLEERRQREAAKRYFRQNNVEFFDTKMWVKLFFSGFSMAIGCGFLYALFVSFSHIHFQYILGLIGIMIARTLKQVAHTGNRKIALLTVCFYAFSLFMSFVFTSVLMIYTSIPGASFMGLLTNGLVYRMAFQQITSLHFFTVFIFIFGGIYGYQNGLSN